MISDTKAGREKNMNKFFKNIIHWLLFIAIALLSSHCIPNNSGYPPFQAVTGKLPLCPKDLPPTGPKDRKDFDTFMKKFISRIREPNFHPPPFYT